MADHLSQFSMLGSAFNPQLVSNPNASGPSQQQSPSDSMQPIGGLPNPEHSRMWMQLQQQVNQQRTASSGDMVGSQMVGQQLQRQTFSAGPGQSTQLQHNHILSQFQNNAALSQMTAPQLQAAFQQNRPASTMLAGLQPNQARHLELMMAQHQSPHNNQVNGLVASRLNQSQAVQQGFPQGMISGIPNPGQPSQAAIQMFNGTTTQDTKRVALQELRNRSLHLHTNIKAIEQQQAAFTSHRSAMGEAMFLQKMAIAEQDIARKRAVLTKWNMMLSANGMPPIGQGM
jgi:hypothetical protein